MIRHPAPTAMAICNLENFMASTPLRPEPKTLLKSRTVCSRRTGYFRGENEVCTFAVKVRITLVRKFDGTILATFYAASILSAIRNSKRKGGRKCPPFAIRKLLTGCRRLPVTSSLRFLELCSLLASGDPAKLEESVKQSSSHLGPSRSLLLFGIHLRPSYDP